MRNLIAVRILTGLQYHVEEHNFYCTSPNGLATVNSLGPHFSINLYINFPLKILNLKALGQWLFQSKAFQCPAYLDGGFPRENIENDSPLCSHMKIGPLVQTLHAK
jgi:hypothetical protein